MGAEVGIGNVTVTLGGKAYEMVPTLAAAQGISRQAGGIRVAIEQVWKLDIDTMTAVVRFGLGPKVAKELGDNLPQLVWEAGFTDSGGGLLSKCVDFLTNLTNSGRPLTSDENKTAEEGSEKNLP